MFCHICLKEKGDSCCFKQVDRLILCKDCTEKVKDSYNEAEIKEL